MTREEDDTISREAALNLMRSLTRWSVMSEDGKFSNVGLLYDDVMFGIDRLPSANTTKTGHWILTSDDDYEYCTCSECGYQNGENWMIGSQIKYCQECGAKMVEPQESEDKE